MDDCKFFRKDSLGGQGGDIACCAEEFIKCTEDCYEIGNRFVQSLWVGNRGDIVVNVCYRPWSSTATEQS